jgi:translocator assembly and maintenance protein 41
VRLANQVNLASAFRTALLLLPEEFTESQLYEQIASISYLGDFRMRIGENPLKVRNIVEAQLDSFRLLYGGLIKSFWRSVKLGGESSSSNVIGMGGVRMIKQDVSKERRALTASNLPVGVKSKLLAKFQGKTNLRRAAMISEGGSGSQVIAEEMDQTELWINIVEDAEFKQMLIQSTFSHPFSFS